MTQSSWSAYVQAYSVGSLQKLKLVHHRGARYVKNDNSRQSSATAMLQDLGWHSLQHRYANAQLLMSRKCLIDLLHFNFNQYPRLTRQRHSLSLHLNKNYAFSSPLYVAFSRFEPARLLFHNLYHAAHTYPDCISFSRRRIHTPVT